MHLRKFFFDDLHRFYTGQSRHIDIHHDHIRIGKLHIPDQSVRIGESAGACHSLGVVDQLLQAFPKGLVIFKYGYFYFHEQHLF